jgi:hypothetical protein
MGGKPDPDMAGELKVLSPGEGAFHLCWCGLELGLMLGHSQSSFAHHRDVLETRGRALAKYRVLA